MSSRVTARTRPAGSPVRSPGGSPVRSPSGSPVHSPGGSPVRRPASSPLSSPITPDAKELADPGSPDFRVDQWPFYLIARTASRYEMDMEGALRRIGMDVPSWRALMLLHERNPSSVSEIATQAVLRLSTMTRVVQRLEKRGLVKIARRPADARVTDVYITAEGEQTVEQVRAIASRIYQSAFKDLSAADIETLNSLLRRVFNNL